MLHCFFPGNLSRRFTKKNLALINLKKLLCLYHDCTLSNNRNVERQKQDRTAIKSINYYYLEMLTEVGLLHRIRLFLTEYVANIENSESETGVDIGNNSPGLILYH